MTTSRQPDMQLCIMDHLSTLHKFKLSPNSPISTLKNLLSDCIPGMPPEKQSILYQEKPLDDTHSLLEACIPNRAMLVMVMVVCPLPLTDNGPDVTRHIFDQVETTTHRSTPLGSSPQSSFLSGSVSSASGGPQLWGLPGALPLWDSNKPVMPHASGSESPDNAGLPGAVSQHPTAAGLSSQLADLPAVAYAQRSSVTRNPVAPCAAAPVFVREKLGTSHLKAPCFAVAVDLGNGTQLSSVTQGSATAAPQPQSATLPAVSPAPSANHPLPSQAAVSETSGNGAQICTSVEAALNLQAESPISGVIVAQVKPRPLISARSDLQTVPVSFGNPQSGKARRGGLSDALQSQVDSILTRPPRVFGEKASALQSRQSLHAEPQQPQQPPQQRQLQQQRTQQALMERPKIDLAAGVHAKEQRDKLSDVHMLAGHDGFISQYRQQQQQQTQVQKPLRTPVVFEPQPSPSASPHLLSAFDYSCPGMNHAFSSWLPGVPGVQTHVKAQPSATGQAIQSKFVCALHQLMCKQDRTKPPLTLTTDLEPFLSAPQSASPLTANQQPPSVFSSTYSFTPSTGSSPALPAVLVSQPHASENLKDTPVHGSDISKHMPLIIASLGELVTRNLSSAESLPIILDAVMAVQNAGHNASLNNQQLQQQQHPPAGLNAESLTSCESSLSRVLAQTRIQGEVKHQWKGETLQQQALSLRTFSRSITSHITMLAELARLAGDTSIALTGERARHWDAPAVREDDVPARRPIVTEIWL